jgi:hypothetical protein
MYMHNFHLPAKPSTPQVQKYREQKPSPPSNQHLAPAAEPVIAAISRVKAKGRKLTAGQVLLDEEVMAVIWIIARGVTGRVFGEADPGGTIVACEVGPAVLEDAVVVGVVVQGSAAGLAVLVGEEGAVQVGIDVAGYKDGGKDHGAEHFEKFGFWGFLGVMLDVKLL